MNSTNDKSIPADNIHEKLERFKSKFNKISLYILCFSGFSGVALLIVFIISIVFK